jgi:Carboxypeptidase regulatory-like domain/TonB dependent receptor
LRSDNPIPNALPGLRPRNSFKEKLPMPTRDTWIRIAALVLCLGLSSAILAQGLNASVSGTVTDPSGAVIDGASVTVTNTGTTLGKTVKSDSTGHYSAADLNPGTYDILVTAPGFATKKVNAIILAVAQVSRQDVSLSTGAANEVITVESAAVTTETETSAVGSVVDRQQVLGMPLDARSYFTLPLLSPGVSLPAQNSQTGYRGGFSVNGQDETANNILIDGYDSNDRAVSVPSFRPSIEAIQEFRLLTGIYPAEFGRVTGGQVVFVQKSGTNAFHGDAFLFIYNTIANAHPYVLPLPGALNLPNASRRGQFGGTIGGPIIKDRTFFFAAYEGLALTQYASANATVVPTAAAQAGIFSGTCNTSAASGLFDPSTHAAVPCTANPNVANGLGALVANYSLLPVWTSPQATLGRAVAAEYPTATSQLTTGQFTTGVGPYLMNENRVDNAKTFTIRIDHKLSNADGLEAEYDLYREAAYEPSNNLCGSALIPHFGCYEFQNSQLAGATWTHTFTPNLLNEFKIDWNREAQVRAGEDAFLPQSMFVNTFPPLGVVPGVPHTGGSVNVSVTGLATIGNANLPQSHTEDQYEIVEDVTWTKGHHTFKAGVDLHDNISDNYFLDDARGSAAINDATLKANAGAAYATGNNVADLLLGYPATVTLNPTDPKFSGLESAAHFFLQDDWKVTPYLTLNLGLRYELTTPVHEAHNQMSSVLVTVPGSVTAATATTPAGQTIGTVTTFLQGSNGNKYLYHFDKNNFAPRVGLSWQPTHSEKTVIHAGFGVYYSVPPSLNAFLNMYRQPPERLISTYTSTNLATLNFTSPAGTAAAQFTPTGVDPNFATTYNMGYTFDVQQQLSKGLLLEGSYYGSETRRISNDINLNQAVATGLSGSAAFLRPYPAYGNVTIIHSQANADYNSLQLKLQQQFRNGISFLLGYTYSKSMDNAPGLGSTSSSSGALPQNSLCPACERGLSDFNQKSRLVMSPVVQLPFGQGKMFLKNGNRIVNSLVSGYQISSLVQVQTGRPFTIYNTNTNATLSQNSTDRPNQYANPNTGAPGSRPGKLFQWFNTEAFALDTCTAVGNVMQANPAAASTNPTPSVPVSLTCPGVGTGHTVATNTTGGTATVYGFGNEHRNSVIGPGLVQWDLALQRNFAFPDTQRFSASLRFEAINVLNHPGFQDPVGTGAAGAVGGASYGEITLPCCSVQPNSRDLQISGKFFF